MDLTAAVVRQIAWTDETGVASAVRHFGVVLAPILHHEILGASLVTAATSSVSPTKGAYDAPRERPFDWAGPVSVFTGCERDVPFNTRRMHRWEIEKRLREQFQLRLQALKEILVRVLEADEIGVGSSRALCSFVAQLLREVVEQHKGTFPPLSFSPDEDPARRATRIARRVPTCRPSLACRCVQGCVAATDWLHRRSSIASLASHVRPGALKPPSDVKVKAERDALRALQSDER
jgi:hypothetical protein